MDRVSQAIDEVLNDPARFMADYWEKTRIEGRKAELEKLGMDEVRSKRGWYGYELPNCQWNKHFRPSTDVANWRDWPGVAPKYVIKTVKPGENYTCLLLRRAVLYMPDNEWEDLMDEVRKVKEDYPVLSDDTWSTVQDERQSEEWASYYRDEFRKALQEEFAGAFLPLQYGERLQQKFDDLVQTDEFVDELYYDYLSSGRGGEWDEDQSGDMRIDVDRIVNEYDVQIMAQRLWPEDQRQLHLKLESLAESLVDRLLGEDEGPHSYSCVMIDLPEELADRIRAWGREQIPAKDLYVDEKGGLGFEDEIHVTVKYGLTAAQPDDRLKAVFNKTQPFEITLGACSVFENSEFDVVKMDVHSPYLMALNRNVNAVAEAPGDTHPVYQPHVTIAYVKPGLGARFIGSSPFDSAMKFGVSSIGKEGHFTAKSVIFSSIDDSKKEYPLGHSDLTAKAVEEADDSPEAMSALINKAIPSERKMATAGARRLFGRAVVDRVEISYSDRTLGEIGGFGNPFQQGWHAALLEVYFFVGPELQVWRDYWSSMTVLAEALRRWSNLQGAPLVFNGDPAGEISYDNPALTSLSRS